MTLRTKTLSIIGLTLLSLLAVLFMVSSRIVGRSFRQLEMAENLEHCERIETALDDELVSVDNSVLAWSQWDDAYAYMATHDRSYQANLTDSSLAPTKAEAIFYVEPSGRLLEAIGYDTHAERRAPLPPWVRSYFARPNPFVAPGVTPRPRTGTVAFGTQVMLVAARPIVPTDGSGPPRGTMIFGRYLTPEILGVMSHRLSLSLRLIRLTGMRQAPEAARLLAMRRPGETRLVLPESSREMGAYVLFQDVAGRQSFALRGSSVRDIYARGLLARRYLVVALFVVGVVFSLVTLVVVEKMVLRRLMRLNLGVRRVSRHGRPDIRLPRFGSDEIGGLAADINGMLDALEQTQGALEDREELFRRMALSASDVLYDYDIASDNLHWYGHVDGALGYPPGTIARTMSGWAELLHPDDYHRVVPLVQAACETGSRFEMEYRMRRADGSYATWIERGAGLKGPDGAVNKLVGACTDVTDQRAAAQRLRESEERLSRIVETNADGIVIVDLEGRITFANAAAERIYGMSRDEMTARVYNDPVWDITMPEGAPLPDGSLPFARVIEANQPMYGVEYAIQRPDGQRLVLSANAAPLRDSEGRAIGVVTSISDVTTRKSLEERLAHQAYHDPLTQLPNRTMFLERLEHALCMTDHADRRVAVLFLDLDHFKVINDSLGHATGDHLLIAVADRIRSCLRERDLAARFGGDEFTVMMTDVTDEAGPLHVAERIRARLTRPFRLGSREVFVSASLGIALGRPGHDLGEDLLRNADAAMYEAKNNGRGRSELFHIGLSRRAMHRLEMEQDLRRALLRRELVLHYQPKVDAGTGRVVGAEALVRWQRPDGSMMLPMEFIPLAEEIGLEDAVGRTVLADACRQLQRWRERGLVSPTFHVSVNVSGRHFQEGLVGDVADVLRREGLDAGALSLEITEGMIIQENEPMLAVLQDLKRLGVRLELDDFGTGYSSLSYLRRFPLDMLKIDRSFVEGLGRDRENSLIVASTISLAHALNLTVVAEGVETEDQVRELRRLDCDILQGYWFGRPMPPEQMERELRRFRESGLGVNLRPL